MSKQCFKSTMALIGNNTGIEVPAPVIEALGGGKKPAVNVTVNGFAYRSTIAVMGGRYLISFSADKRAATGIAGGDKIEVTLELDTAPRMMEVPADLQRALDRDKAAKTFFSTLSFSNQRRHIDPINAAKTPETRARRIEKSVALLHEGKA